MGLNLLEKTELWVNEITLANANLSDMADAVAEQLGLDKGKVMVVDVRPRHITFDVLERNVPQAGIMGKERAILSALAALPGVCLTDKSYIHSNGILGLICVDVEEPEAVLDRVSNMTREIQEKVSRRAIVFPTGFELKQGMIQDTNTPFLKHELEERGYYVTVGRSWRIMWRMWWRNWMTHCPRVWPDCYHRRRRGGGQGPLGRGSAAWIPRRQPRIL